MLATLAQIPLAPGEKEERQILVTPNVTTNANTTSLHPALSSIQLKGSYSSITLYLGTYHFYQERGRMFVDGQIFFGVV